MLAVSHAHRRRGAHRHRLCLAARVPHALDRFVLAIFVGYMVIWNVTPALHTPLMSVTNAISSIIIIGALIQVSTPVVLVWILAAIAVTITFVNITGGFSVTWRMLKMFRK